MSLPSLTPLQEGIVWFVAWTAAAMLAAQAAAWLCGSVLMRLAKRTRTDLDESLLAATRAPLRILVLLAVLNLGSSVSLGRLPEVVGHPSWPILTGVLYVGLVLAAAWAAGQAVSAVAKWYAARLGARGADAAGAQFVSLFRKVAQLLVFFIAMTVIFEHFDVQITALLATAGIASLAVAFAAQETLSNMIAGFALMADRPFKVGDRIQFADGRIGDVIEVGLRSTRMLSFDNTVISMPNAEVAKSQVINFSAPDSRVKLRSTIGVAYGSDVRKAKAILADIMNAHPDVLKQPPPAVYFSAFADSSLTLLMVCWVADYREQFRIVDELNLAIKDRFEAEGISIPFPQRDVHLYTVRGGQ